MSAGIEAAFTIDRIAVDPAKFDEQHRGLCSKIIGEAKKRGLTLSHGRAAKLLNVYFKVRFVCGPDHSNERVPNIHPPIDRQLLNGLADENAGGFREVWSAAASKGWSKFDRDDYQSVIEQIKVTVVGKPLWTIEKFWPGHQL